MMRFFKRILFTVTFSCLLSSSAFATMIDELTRATDYDGDGIGDLILQNPTTGTLYIRKSSNKAVVAIDLDAQGMPVLGDFDGDAKADVGVFNRSTARWTIKYSTGSTASFILGNAGDFPVPADYAASGCTQAATYNPRSGVWTLGDCSGNKVQTVTFSLPGSYAVPADYDCDGHADLAIYQRYKSRWIIRQSSDSQEVSFIFGKQGDLPIPGDYKNVGCAQPATYRPWTREYRVADSYVNGGTAVSLPAVSFGSAGDRPVLANVDGDFVANYVVFRPSEQKIYVKDGRSTGTSFSGVTLDSNQVLRPVSPSYVLHYAVKGDYNGDGRADFVTASVDRSEETTLYTIAKSQANTTSFTSELAAAGDALVPADYDGDGMTDPAVVTVIDADTLRWRISEKSGAQSFDFGQNEDQPIAGDFDCDGKADPTVVRKTSGGVLSWYIKKSTTSTTTQVSFGKNDDRIFVGDVNGDSCDELVSVRLVSGNYRWYYKKLGSSLVPSLSWGTTNDAVLSPMDVNGDGLDDFVVKRTVNGSTNWYVRYSQSAWNRLTPTSAPYAVVRFGSSGDVPALGHYDGPSRAEVGFYRRTGTPAYYFKQYYKTAKSVVTGSASAIVVRPDGTVVQPSASDGESSAGCSASPNTPNDFSDGTGTGSLWKPVGEGGSCPGHITILLPGSYWSGSAAAESITALSSTGSPVATARKRYVYKDGRGVYDICAVTSAQLKAYAPVTIKIVRADGLTECRAISDPTQRID